MLCYGVISWGVSYGIMQENVKMTRFAFISMLTDTAIYFQLGARPRRVSAAAAERRGRHPQQASCHLKGRVQLPPVLSLPGSVPRACAHVDECVIFWGGVQVLYL